jgi:hypothetical protein
MAPSARYSIAIVDTPAILHPLCDRFERQEIRVFLRSLKFKNTFLYLPVVKNEEALV